MADKDLVMQAIEPHTMTLPAMDRPSVVLAWFMDNITVEMNGVGEGLCLTCNLCSDPIMDIDDGDTLRVMFNTALAHGC